MFEFLIATAFAAEVNLTAEKNPPIIPDIPIQVHISDDQNYSVFRSKAETFLDEGPTNQCALFVNRLFKARFGKLIFGNAWDLQLKEANQKFLTLIWRIKEKEFNRERNLALNKKEDRIDRFQQLYNVLDSQKHPVGVLGFVYEYSFYREYVASLKYAMPQTHITFVAGKKQFFFENTADMPQSLEQILVEKYGVIHDFERDFVWEKVPLKKRLQPGERYYYTDYLIEHQYKKVVAKSLLEEFLRKHRNNHVTPLLHPVSFSRISDNLITEIETQNRSMKSLGTVEYITRDKYENWFDSNVQKTTWDNRLTNVFSEKIIQSSLIFPVPKRHEVVANID